MKRLFFALVAMLAVFACNKPDVEETPALEVSTQKITVNSFGGDRVLGITSNNAWTIQADADWVSFSENSGNASAQKQEIKVYVDENTAAEARTAKITVKSGPLEKVVDVEQEAATETPDPDHSEWALVGTFNEWSEGSELYLSVLDEEYFVYYGLELATDSEFKFLKGGAWPPAGTEIGGNGLVEPNTIQPAGGSNIKVTEAGKYDIYLASDLTKFYIMSEGKLPAEATEPAPVENQWGMMGCFVDNQWASDVPMTKEGEWIVAKGAQFTELTFKIRANASWADATNIGRAPGSERAVVNGRIEVVTAEYAKANLGGDAADIKLNGEPGTYDVYFSFENLEVYVMEAGFKPGEKEPQNPDPVEITYTVVGTIADNVWSNNAEIGLMAKEGDYLVAKNIPFVWNSTCYGGDYNVIEFKIVETGTWDGFAYPEKNVDEYANAEITVQIGGENIALNAPEGSYDVYFDKANKKVWVMEAGFKPGEKEPLVPSTGDYDIDGKQWVFTWEALGVPAVFDLGVTAPGEFYFAYDMSTFGEEYAGEWFPYYSGTYTVEKKDGTTGVLKVTLVDPYEGTELAAEIPYTMTAEDAATFDTSAIKAQLDVESVSATVSSELIDLTGGQGGGAEGLADGEYWIISGGKVAVPISEAGNLPTVDAVDGKSTASNAFKFTLVDETEYLYSIKDSKEMYLYLTEDEKFAVSADNGGYSDPYCWQVVDMQDGTFYIANYNTMGAVQLLADGTYACVQDMVGTYPALVLAENPIPEPEGPAELTGTGTETDPYVLSTADHMLAMRTLAVLGETTYFRMANDIDMASVANWTPVNWDENFEREIHFDGNGKTITNFAPTSFMSDDQTTAAQYPSLFGVLYGSCKNLTIKNSKIIVSETTPSCAFLGGYVGTAGKPAVVENVSVQGEVYGGSCVGALAGQSNGTTTYRNCTIDAVLTSAGTDLGGIVGKIRGDSEMTGCTVKATFVSTAKTKNRVGGMIGWNSTATTTITDCHVLEGTTLTDQSGRTDSDNGNYGGFIGFGDSAGTVLKISNCSAHAIIDAGISTYNAGFIGGTGYESTVEVTDSWAAGSVIGANYSAGFIGAIQSHVTISRCWADVDVTSSGQRCGAFAGCNTKFPATITNCYATGDITATNQQVGGIIGYASKPVTITNCYATGNVSSATAGTGGIAGTISAESTVSDCIAWNATIDCQRTANDKWAPGAVVGAAEVAGNYSGCYRRADMNLIDAAGAMVLVDHEDVANGSPAAPSYSDATTQRAYHGKAAAADATVSSVAKALGWDESVWDLSGDMPVLK